MNSYDEMPEKSSPDMMDKMPLDCPDELQKCLKECHGGMTIKQFQSVISYCQDKISVLRKAGEEDLTIEDFEDAKKEDIDNDNEEGEE